MFIAAACTPAGTNDSSPLGGTQGTWYSLADKAALIVECVRERGFSAEVYEGIGIKLGGPQLEEAEQAEAKCAGEVEAAYPGPPPLSGPELYDALLETAECLRDEGISVRSAPTIDTWIDNDRRWNPYDYVNFDDDFWALHSICPQPGLGLTAPTSSAGP